MKTIIIRASEHYAPAIAAIGKEAFSKAFAHLFLNKAELASYLDKTYDTSKSPGAYEKKTGFIFLPGRTGNL